MIDVSSTDGNRTYEVFDAVPLQLDAIATGTSLLIAGPPMTGKAELAFDVLAAGVRRDQGALVATTETSATSAAESFHRAVGDAGDRLAIVDAHGNEARSPAPEGRIVEYASSPSDLTGISIAVTECLRAFEERGVTDLRLSFRSISTLLCYLDAEAVFRFLHVFTSHIERAGVLGVFTLNEAAHDDRTVGMIQAIFDGMLQVRETDAGDRQVRAVGLADGPTDWTDF